MHAMLGQRSSGWGVLWSWVVERMACDSVVYTAREIRAVVCVVDRGGQPMRWCG